MMCMPRMITMDLKLMAQNNEVKVINLGFRLHRSRCWVIDFARFFSSFAILSTGVIAMVNI